MRGCADNGEHLIALRLQPKLAKTAKSADREVSTTLDETKLGYNGDLPMNRRARSKMTSDDKRQAPLRSEALIKERC